MERQTQPAWETVTTVKELNKAIDTKLRVLLGVSEPESDYEDAWEYATRKWRAEPIPGPVKFVKVLSWFATLDFFTCHQVNRQVHFD